jgi:asparagine synthase (glutamine-hydrolysing)
MHSKEALDLIDDLPYYYDEPFADSSAIPTTLVCKMARKQVTVALSADAGDEIFAGYNRYDYIMKYGKKLNQLPKFIRKGTSGLMNGLYLQIEYLFLKINIIFIIGMKN